MECETKISRCWETQQIAKSTKKREPLRSRLNASWLKPSHLPPLLWPRRHKAKRNQPISFEDYVNT